MFASKYIPVAQLTFKLSERLYLKDPQATALGQRIVQKAIELIDVQGFEQFTFKKLALEVESTEPSVYRYFENKHRLLHYLVAWYWSWVDYRLDLATTNLASAEEKLRVAIRVITEEKRIDDSFQHVNEEALYRIVVNELEKTFFTKWVDDDNKDGLFAGFKTLTQKISGYIAEIAPEYEFPNALVCTMLLAAHEQMFFAAHLPALSNIDRKLTTQQQHSQLRKLIESIVFGALRRK